MRADTKLLIQGIAHPRSNIGAIHFDGEVLNQMVFAKRELDEKRHNPPRFVAASGSEPSMSKEDA